MAMPLLRDSGLSLGSLGDFPLVIRVRALPEALEGPASTRLFELAVVRFMLQLHCVPCWTCALVLMSEG